MPNPASNPIIDRMRAWCDRVSNGHNRIPEPRSRPIAKCLYIGEPTGEEIECPTCPGNRGIRLKTLSCSLHGRCTPQTPLPNIKCCTFCTDRMPVEAQIVVPVNGIGDHILALAHSQWRQERGTKVTFVCKEHILPWVSLFDSYTELRTTDHNSLERLPLPTTSDALWAEEIHKLQLSPPKLKPISETLLGWNKDTIILCPGSGYRRPGATIAHPNNRVWLQSHWQALEDILIYKGKKVVVLDDEPERIKWAKNPIIGLTPEKVVARIKDASCVVANESGLAHLAGAIGTPCLVLAGPTNSREIHKLWKNTYVIQGPLACSGCRFTGPNFRPIVCDSLCASLQYVQPEDVMLVVDKIAR